MASSVPIIKQPAWFSLIPQLIVIGLLIFLYHLVDFGDPFLLGALTYFLLTFVLRNLVAKKHRQGIRLVKQHKFAEALPFFEQSVAYFTKKAWVDKFRFITLLSSSKMSYREMGLCNIAFCYSQTGNGQQAKNYYEQVLQEFPENGLAIAGLNMLESMEPKAQVADF